MSGTPYVHRFNAECVLPSMRSGCPAVYRRVGPRGWEANDLIVSHCNSLDVSVYSRRLSDFGVFQRVLWKKKHKVFFMYVIL